METDPSIVTKVYECFFIEFSTVDIEAHRCLRLPPPRLVCGTRLVTGARLLSVQVNQTPGLYAGPGVYPGASFYPKFYGNSFCK